jgi:hypothetical protein
MTIDVDGAPAGLPAFFVIAGGQSRLLERAIALSEHTASERAQPLN